MESGNVTITRAMIEAEDELLEKEAARTGLFAKIRRTSKYYGQDGGKAFSVSLFSDGEYIVHGNDNRYRLADVDIYWSNNAGQLFKA